MSDDGLSSGAFLGSVQFLSMSYLWSRELWSSVFTSFCTLRKRITFLLLIMACGIIASTSGRSSAILLIPRMTLWPLNSTYVLINGTMQDIWPDALDPQTIPSQCSFIEQEQSQEDSICPGANWYSLYSYIESNEASFFPDGGKIDNLASEDLGSYEFSIEGPGTQYTYESLNGCSMDQKDLQVCGRVGPVIGALAAFNDTSNWYSELMLDSWLDLYHSVNQNLYSATVAVK